MIDPSVDHGLRNVVVSKGLDEDLATSRKLASENPMGPVRLLQGSTLIPDGASEVFRRVLNLEALDAVSIGPLEQEADHGVVEAAIDEVVDDGL